MENNYIETMQAEYATDEDAPVYSKFMEYKRAKVDPLNYTSNKDINIKTIDSIYIKNFRSLKERKLELGKHITIVTGKNGTMKSSILGLIAHPFSPSGDDVKDVFGDILKTDMKDVFRLSLDKDKDQYEYFILLTSDKDEKIIEPIRIFLSSDDKRHRVVVSGKNKGDGNFNMKTNYVNLQRLFPIINTQAKETEIQLTDEDKEFLEMAYQQIIQKTEYSKSSTVQEKALKRTLSPKDSYYDYNSISSGEDNLGAILLRLLSFKKLVDEKNKQNMLQGVLCIDEIEASLHPSAVINLFEFLLKFSRKNNIQIVFTTHSLHLMQYCLDRYIKVTNNDEIKINNISTVMVGSDRNYNVVINPEYSNICKELTYNSDELINLYKVNILCEDKMAEKFIKTIIKTQKINNAVSFVVDEEGIAYSGIIALAKNSKKY
ncbi:AAA family ATPase [Campylobacter concisus]|uniref:AAA family ATPase n=1 Tax=Campylobacter concisus TaxID=199 RepID=UPI000CD94EF4|nr:AAA family ATPase [Campylobacter concisus]